MDITSLIKRVQKGETAEFREVVLYFQAHLLSFIMSLIPDIHQARDLCQETFIKYIVKLTPNGDELLMGNGTSVLISKEQIMLLEYDDMQRVSTAHLWVER